MREDSQELHEIIEEPIVPGIASISIGIGLGIGMGGGGAATPESWVNESAVAWTNESAAVWTTT